MSYHEKNIFGEGLLYEASDLKGTIYCLCTACMSIWSEFLSWANLNEQRFVNDPVKADNIIVLSCQVTDLAILNDLRAIEHIMEKSPGSKYYIGGCLARRFDIELPLTVKRLDHIRHDYQSIDYTNLIQYAKPFWVKQFKDTGEELDDGRLFRDMYPLRVSVGCNKKCEYCTIRTTRGTAYQLDTVQLLDEFKKHENVVLIADSPPAQIIREWCLVAYALQKPISIRNIEPEVVVTCWDYIMHIAKAGLLKIFHSPIQSMNQDILKAMKRPVNATLDYIARVPYLRATGVIVATNIITDYRGFEDFPISAYEELFDYVSWNPLWDGKWDRQKAEERFDRLLP